MVQMPPETLWKLHAAIKKKEGFTFQDEQTSRPLFILDWYRRSFTNPVTGETITAQYGWNIYKPKDDPEDVAEASHPQEDVVGRLCLRFVTLLTEDSEMGRRTSAKELAVFIDVVSNRVEQLHEDWIAKRKGVQKPTQEEKEKKTDEKEKGGERGKETEATGDKDSEGPVFMLREDQELIVQVELGTSGKLGLAGRVVEGDYEEEWMDFILQQLIDVFADSSTSPEKASLPKVVDGSVSFLLHYHQPRK